jgi:hypothetical protein
VHQAGAGFDGYVATTDDGYVTGLEGVAEQHLLECRAPGGTEYLAGQGIALQAGVGEFANQDQRALRSVDQLVFEVRVGADRLVGRQGPRGGRPDDGESGATQVAQAEGPGHFVGVIGMHFESNIDRRRALVFVFDFGFGQCRATVETPVDRLEALVEVAFFKNRAERADFVGLGLEVHRQVGIVPLAENAEADEVLLLTRDLLGGKSAAKRTHLVGRHVFAVQQFDLMLDRQAVAIPAGNVGGVETGQGLGADDDVLEDLVDRMADVNVAVGVGRAIVQDETWPSLRGRADALVELALLPGGDPLWLAAGEIATHRKRRVGQVEGFLVVSHGGSRNWK